MWSSDAAGGQGTAGFPGLTLHATASGRPTASMTLAGYSQANIINGRLSVLFGTDPVGGSAFMFIYPEQLLRKNIARNSEK
jgi:hypothetical protein